MGKVLLLYLKGIPHAPLLPTLLLNGDPPYFDPNLACFFAWKLNHSLFLSEAQRHHSTDTGDHPVIPLLMGGDLQWPPSEWPSDGMGHIYLHFAGSRCNVGARFVCRWRDRSYRNTMNLDMPPVQIRSRICPIHLKITIFWNGGSSAHLHLFWFNLFCSLSFHFSLITQDDVQSQQ